MKTEPNDPECRCGPCAVPGHQGKEPANMERTLTEAAYPNFDEVAARMFPAHAHFRPGVAQALHAIFHAGRTTGWQEAMERASEEAASTVFALCGDDSPAECVRKSIQALAKSGETS